MPPVNLKDPTWWGGEGQKVKVKTNWVNKYIGDIFSGKNFPDKDGNYETQRVLVAYWDAPEDVDMVEDFVVSIIKRMTAGSFKMETTLNSREDSRVNTSILVCDKNGWERTHQEISYPITGLKLIKHSFYKGIYQFPNENHYLEIGAIPIRGGIIITKKCLLKFPINRVMMPFSSPYPHYPYCVYGFKYDVVNDRILWDEGYSRLKGTKYNNNWWKTLPIYQFGGWKILFKKGWNHIPGYMSDDYNQPTWFFYIYDTRDIVTVPISPVKEASISCKLELIFDEKLRRLSLWVGTEIGNYPKGNISNASFITENNTDEHKDTHWNLTYNYKLNLSEIFSLTRVKEQPDLDENKKNAFLDLPESIEFKLRKLPEKE